MRAEIRNQLTLPVMVAPMFLCSSVAMAIESCKAGIVGTLTRNHCRSDEEFEQQVRDVTEAIAAVREVSPGMKIGPLAVNMSIGNTQPASMKAAVETCIRHGVDIIVTAGGDPTRFVEAAHSWGGRVFHDVTSLRFAEKAIKAGVDGLIAIGAGGGGHSGTISHLVFIPQLRAMFDGVIVMAGAVANGAAVRAAEILGADLSYMGTRFIATKESQAPDDYKAMLVSQTPADLIYTGAINGLPAMWMKESLRRVGLDPDHLPQFTRGDGDNPLPPTVKPWSNLWSAGQGVAFIDDIPTVSELVDRLKKEYQTTCAIPAYGAI